MSLHGHVSISAAMVQVTAGRAATTFTGLSNVNHKVHAHAHLQGDKTHLDLNHQAHQIVDYKIK